MELIARPHVETRPQPRDAVLTRLAARDRVVGEHEVHELVEVDVRVERELAVPHVEAVARRRPREVDADVPAGEAALGRVHRVRQAVELRHLLERAQQAESDDVEQRDGAARNVADAVTLDHLLDDALLSRVLERRRPEPQADLPYAEQPGRLVHLRGVQQPPARQQGSQEVLGGLAGAVDAPVAFRRASLARVLGDRVVRDHEHRDAVVLEAPVQQHVLAEAPLAMQHLVELDERAALTQAHLVRNGRERVEIASDAR